MHSTLHAEVRFTRVLTATCRHCARNLPRSFHSARRLQVPQRPQNNDTSLTGPAVTSDAREPRNRTETAKESVSHDNVPPSPAQTTSPGNPPSAIEKPLSEFHGSPAKRRMRSRMSKAVDLEYEPPEWFPKVNILLHDENQLPCEFEIIPTTPRARTTLDSAGKNTEGGPAAPDDSSSPDNSIKPHGSPRYAIDEAQYEEVWRTARGLLKVPHDQLHRLPEADNLRNHLLLSFVDKHGDLFLDALVRELARDLGCDLMALDAQDLVELYKGAFNETEGATPERLLSYEIFTEAYPDYSIKARERPNPEEEQDEDEDDESDHPNMDALGRMGESGALGLPIMVGKPISINLKDLFDGPAGRAIWRDRSRPTRGSLSNSKHSGSEGVVPGLFQSLDRRQAPSSQTLKSQPSNDQAIGTGHTPKPRTIVHIKDLRAIQDTDLGQRFMSSLFEEVGKRRKRGQNIIIVGTDSARNEPMRLDKLHDIQTGGQTEISQNIVLTPGYRPGNDLIFSQDGRRRISVINMRHLWDALRYRDPSIFAELKPGFWHGEAFNRIPHEDLTFQGYKVWSYAYVHRIAAFMAGASEFTEQTEVEKSESPEWQALMPIIAAQKSLAVSDEGKVRWFEREQKRRSTRTLNRFASQGKPSMELPDKNNKDQALTAHEEESMKEESPLRKLQSTVSKYEKKLMNGIIEAKNISTTFNDVHMPVETIDALNTMTTLSLTRPDAFKYGVLASDKIPGLLLYGPPGTGKTLAAKAVARESGATMLEVSAADINDMYVGEGEKNVKAVFSLARKLSPCVVFLDEADAIFSARGNQGRRASHREILNQFLKEWDGMSNDSTSAFIMVATNRPMDLDDAVLRRLPRRLLVDLPTESDRLAILQIHLRNETLADDLDLATIAKNTPFYSGSDLKNACVAAALNAVREENHAASQHTGDQPYQYPERRTLTAKHFERALEDISASVSEDMNSLRDIKKFDEQYGDKRGKKKKNPRLGFPTSKPQKDTVKVRE
ncbi:hypothetical protein B0A52_00135 [Exophiala mesophila]|uniref:AAA+ ATPase domain-containing protein n=1 Tax=Exophiala mesophila TaxID=212818 RepID=A0A438NJ67_EXOME|nr:hypothetical protein B0A52_00135 [Exophiala mesophila]